MTKLAKPKAAPRDAAADTRAPVLDGVVALVEVYSDGEPCTEFAKKAESLGAAIRKNLADDVTHVIFREGKKALFDRAFSRDDLHVVSVLWLEECLKTRSHVDEARFLYTRDHPIADLRKLKRPSSGKPAASSKKVAEEDAEEEEEDEASAAAKKLAPKRPAAAAAAAATSTPSKGKDASARRGGDDDEEDTTAETFLSSPKEKPSPSVVRTYKKQKPSAERPPPPVPAAQRKDRELKQEEKEEVAEEKTGRQQGKKPASKKQDAREEPTPPSRGARRAIREDEGEEEKEADAKDEDEPATPPAKLAKGKGKEKEKAKEAGAPSEPPQGRKRKAATALAAEEAEDAETERPPSEQSNKKAKSKAAAAAEASSSSAAKKHGVLLVTGVSPSTRDIAISTAKHLGGFDIIDKTEKKRRPTHVICGDNRTLSVLQAICYGSWLLTPEWAMVSLEHARWAPEKDFEASTFYPAACQTRPARAKEGGLRFLEDTLVYIGRLTRAQKPDVATLVGLLHGKVVQVAANADVCIGSCQEALGVDTQKDAKLPPQVMEKWLFESIAVCKRLPYADFLLSKPGKAKSGADSPEY